MSVDPTYCDKCFSAARAENQRLREALEWYANEQHFGQNYHLASSGVELDRGAKALAALNGGEKFCEHLHAEVERLRRFHNSIHLNPRSYERCPCCIARALEEAAAAAARAKGGRQ